MPSNDNSLTNGLTILKIVAFICFIVGVTFLALYEIESSIEMNKQETKANDLCLKNNLEVSHIDYSRNKVDCINSANEIFVYGLGDT